MLAFTRFEVVRTLRNGRFLVFLIAMPAVFFLLFGSRDGPACTSAACPGRPSTSSR